MEQLILCLRTLQANSFIFYTKAHGYHWNVEGILFEQFHSFFSEIYNDLWETVDDWAEWLRRFDVKAAFSVMDAMSASNIKYDLDMNASNPLQMLSSLYNSNEQMLVDLKECFNVATSANEQGLANFIAERIDVQEKLGWKLRASMKSMGSN